jgi:hypothetical protein
MAFRPKKAEEVAETTAEIEDRSFSRAVDEAKKLAMSQLMRTSAVPIDSLRSRAKLR